MSIEVSTYQGFLQIIVQLMASGYHYYSLNMRRLSTEAKWKDNDATVLSNYPLIGFDRFRRARRKKAGLLNGRLIRFRQFQLLLRTDGIDDGGLITSERWKDVRRERLVLAALWDNLDFAVFRLDGRYTVALDKLCWQRVKNFHENVAKHMPVSAAQAHWARIDQELPGWKGLYRQKRSLAKLIVRTARRAGQKCDWSDFPVNPFRRVVNVFSSDGLV